jgi:hypothetical protein
MFSAFCNGCCGRTCGKAARAASLRCELTRRGRNCNAYRALSQLGPAENPPARLFGLHVGTRGRRNDRHAIAARGRNRDCHARIGARWADHAFVPGELAGQRFARPGVRDGLDLTGFRRRLACLLSFSGRACARCGEPCDSAKTGSHPKRNNFAHSAPLSFEGTGGIALSSLRLRRSGASFMRLRRQIRSCLKSLGGCGHHLQSAAR